MATVKLRRVGIYNNQGIRVRRPGLSAWTIQNENGQGLTLSSSDKRPFSLKEGEFLSVEISLRELQKAVRAHIIQ